MCNPLNASSCVPRMFGLHASGCERHSGPPFVPYNASANAVWSPGSVLTGAVTN